MNNRLKKLRIEHNFTKKQLADYLNITPDKIDKLEENEIKLNHNYLFKLSKLYKCSPQYILNGVLPCSNINSDFRINDKNVDLETIADMNNIIENLEFLSRINK